MAASNKQPAYDADLYQALEGAFYSDVHQTPPPGPSRPSSPAYYTQNPAFQSYFSSLPPPVRQCIVRSGVEFSTLGELQQCAEHLMHS